MIESRVEHDGCVHVTFRLPNINRAERISVVGEFNAWCPTANPMHVEGDELVTGIVLQPGRAYRFRYLLDDDRWENDWAADDYVPNEFGGDDSVLDLTNLVTQASEPMTMFGSTTVTASCSLRPRSETTTSSSDRSRPPSCVRSSNPSHRIAP